MPSSMAGVAASVASTSRQTGATLGVAISGSVVGASVARGGVEFTQAGHVVWWLLAGIGLVIASLGLITTSRRALASADRAAALFAGVDAGPPTGRAVAVPSRGGTTGSG
jgi:hypothetical protein